jgi:hypothetical protein
MTQILNEVNGAWIGLVLAALMLLGWGVGWRAGRRRATDPSAAARGPLDDASLAILGLLLGFTFSMSLSKHDARRQMVVTDANAIGDFATCAALVKGPVGEKLMAKVREYVEYRLALSDRPPRGEREVEATLDRVQRMQDEMQGLVREAVDGGTPVTVPLVNTLNEVTSAHTSRVASLRDRLPPSVMTLLLVSAVVSIVLVGREQGAGGLRPVVSTVAFVALVSLVVWVIVDLNQPSRGLIRVSQEPMKRLLVGLGGGQG